ncbi:indolepyruvate oxidoreductase subunit beta [Pelotomaculum schinkii]|uniref:Indolepyruvate oxidoreductase subunit beta n=1 Tax=Pelotomaculum schinkii TaxID=78350 RepID=A0A4Y7R5D3_9FIRM|nr:MULTISPECIES: indolepyruvate oxidoreductase subunit beta [Pelotomaculum]TEB04198.1 indolepyruvate oxidoreductase subunit beta [Pelotomaculum schinkii]TEB17776.1 indolepyruvate oxidoreductase subunit beta [Pelotomaculum sp. FP]
MLKSIDVLMVGVGGQGTILASRVLAQAAQAAGYDIKVSEIHGMAQRGGSVVTQVRLGEKVYSPLIVKGGADVLLAFEKLEALRLLSYLKKDGVLIVNDQAIDPVPVLVGAAEYPPDIPEYLCTTVPGTLVFDATEIAGRCGTAKAANVVLLGAMARRLPIERAIWEKALAERVPAKLLEVNQAAFAAGYELG